jgi:hypothetical protein
MQYVLNKFNSNFFISESISPLFPYQYGHSRRIACDAQNSRISDTEYTMNSVAYGWWLDRLYSFNDPDVLVFTNQYNLTTNENQSRLISGAITGLMLDGDALTNAANIAVAATYLTNSAINAVARTAKTFVSVEGNSGSSAANIFTRQDGAVWELAVFNYSSSVTNITVNLNRAGLPAGYYLATDLWSGATSSVSGTLTVALNAKQAKLFSLDIPTGPPVIVTQPVSYTNSLPTYAGVPFTFSVGAFGSQPVFCQWYEIRGGITNAITGATNTTLTYNTQISDAGASLAFYAVLSNAFGVVASSAASLNLSGGVVNRAPDAVSVQFTITNYDGFAGGFFLTPGDKAGVYAVSNWNIFAITPAGGNSGTQPGVALGHLTDRFGVTTGCSIAVTNVSDGWHQTAQTITNSDTANAHLMNTFWKTHNDSSPSTNTLYLSFNDLLPGPYSAYLYLLQNNSGASGYASCGNVTSYFREFTSFTSSSNFVTALDPTGAANPFVNYLRLTGLGTGSNHSLTFTVVWTNGADGIGVCGVQLVPPILLSATRMGNHFEFEFPAPDGQSYVVDSSTNMVNWVAVATNSATNGTFIFNLNAPTARNFFRVRQ